MSANTPAQIFIKLLRDIKKEGKLWIPEQIILALLSEWV